MRPFDRAFVEETLAALRSIEPERKPKWGRMNRAQMLSHLRTAVRYSLGKEKQTPNVGGFFGRWIAGPLILNGWIRIPHNQKAPPMYDSALPEATLEQFEQELRELLAQVEAGTFQPVPHDYFGDIGPEGWKKLNVVHFEHHLRQFGAVPPNYLRG